MPDEYRDRFLVMGGGVRNGRVVWTVLYAGYDLSRAVEVYKDHRMGVDEPHYHVVRLVDTDTLMEKCLC